MWWNPTFMVVQVSPNCLKVDIYFLLYFKIVFLLNRTCYFDEILDYASACLSRLSNQVSTISHCSKRHCDRCLSFHVSLAVALKKRARNFLKKRPDSLRIFWSIARTLLYHKSTKDHKTACFGFRKSLERAIW